MKKIMYAVMLLLGLSMTTASMAQNNDLNLLLKKKRQQLEQDLANHRYDWLYGTWKTEMLDAVIIIDKDFVYYDENRTSKQPFNLHYELVDPYNEFLDYDIYLYICDIPVDETKKCLYFADEFSIMEYEKIADDSSNQEIFQIVEEMPAFLGGDANLMKYFGDNLKYPQKARENGVQGRVLVNFVVEPNGSITNVKVSSGIGSGCDEEAMRVVKSMPNWKPGKQRGKAVRVSYTIPVSFKL